MDEKLTNALQENVLTLLCFDTESALLVRHCIVPRLFENHIYRKIVMKAVDYIDMYKQAPGDHLPDLLEEELQNDKTKQIYIDTLHQLHQLKDSINSEFILTELKQFIRQQNLKLALVEAVECVKQGQVSQAEVVLYNSLRHTLDVFDSGIHFDNTKQILGFLNKQDDIFYTGIYDLDKSGVCPARKELFTFLAPSNRGKSWALIHFGKKSLQQRLKVLHISLEMSEDRIAQRYIQSFFSISKNSSEVSLPIIDRDRLGKFVGVTTHLESNILTFQDSKIHAKLKDKLEKIGTRYSLVIKQFPTGHLTISALQAYLNNLEQSEKFIPDIIILDYADLMKIDTKNLRIDTGRIYKELRGIAVERNIALITASQSNRESESVTLITMKHLAEDYSKAAISDNIVSYNQTALEKKLGLARLFVAKSRNDESGQTIIITQSYTTGQFCLDSSLMTSEAYFDVIEHNQEGDY